MQCHFFTYLEAIAMHEATLMEGKYNEAHC